MGAAERIVRVLYCSQGHAVHDQRFLQAIRDQGHDAVYLRLGRERANGAASNWPQEVDSVHGAWPLVAPAQGLTIRKAVSKFQPDIIHAGPVQRASFLAALQGLQPLITMSWGSDILLKARTGFGRRAAEYTLARSRAFLCDCMAVRSRALELGMDPHRIVTFPWGVDLDHFSPRPSADLRLELGWQDNLVLISTRAWEPIYGLEILIRGFIEAAKEMPQVRLLLLNTGSMEKKIRSTLQNAGLMNSVHYAGVIDQELLPDYYRSADLYLSASRSDGSSVSLLEALACALPPIGSDIPANREWVKPGQNGWLFEDGSAPALAQTVLRAASDPKARQEYSQIARRIARQRADWSVNALKLTEAYHLALEKEVER